MLRNGKVITVDAADSIAQAVAIRRDEIMAVGSNAAIDLLTGPRTQVIDLAGKTVTPGMMRTSTCATMAANSGRVS